MTDFRDRARQLAATARRVAHLRGATSEAALLAQATAGLIETGSDNWNGGTDFYTLTLEVPIAVYAGLESDRGRDRLESAILKRIQDLTRTEIGLAVTQVVISPTLEEVNTDPTSDAEIADSTPPPAFWSPGHFRLFISHLSKVKASAHKLKVAVGPFQIAAFVAHDDIEPTKEWEAEIDGALRTMDALCAILTPGLVESRWCDQEIGIAIGRGKLVVPIRAGADPHGFLGKYQGLNAINLNAASIAQRLFGVLVKHDQSAPRMADALIDRMSGIRSWEDARRTMTLLESVPRLTRTQVARLVATIEDNAKVSDTHGVPERITALAARVGEPDAT